MKNYKFTKRRNAIGKRKYGKRGWNKRKQRKRKIKLHRKLFY